MIDQTNPLVNLLTLPPLVESDPLLRLRRDQLKIRVEALPEAARNQLLIECFPIYARAIERVDSLDGIEETTDFFTSEDLDEFESRLQTAEFTVGLYLA